MAKGTKNSGFYKQDAIIGRFTADARKPQELNAIVRAGMAEAARQKAYREERAKLEIPRIVR